MTESEFNSAYKDLVCDVVSTLAMEQALGGRGPLKMPKPRGGRGRRGGTASAKVSTDAFIKPRSPVEIATQVLAACAAQRKRTPAERPPDTSDEALSKRARFTDKFALAPYAPFLHYVPRLVNVVTV